MNSRPLLITSNGFGMGHLVRQIALSRQFENATILTLSGAAPVALETGVRLEYCPSYTSPWISKRSWHRGYLKDRIVALAHEVNADVLVFDGVVPYIGLVNAIKELKLPAVWMRRGVWRPTAKTWPLTYSGIFDLVIEPDDVGRSHDQGATKSRSDAMRVGVITEAGAMLERVAAAHTLGVDPSKPTLLFNVGSTRGIDFSQVSLPQGWNVISTSDALQRERSDHQITRVSGIFPLHPYLSAVDLAVTSVGYNAAHEFIACGVPTIVMPSDNATDDQYARADAMVAAGISQRADSGEELDAALREWSPENARRDAASQAKKMSAQWRPGAVEAADLIRNVRAGRHPLPVRARIRTLIERALAIVDRRNPQTPHVSEELTMEMVRSGGVVEHLLRGSSQGYRQRREEIARRWLL